MAQSEMNHKDVYVWVCVFLCVCVYVHVFMCVFVCQREKVKSFPLDFKCVMSRDRDYNNNTYIL